MKLHSLTVALLATSMLSIGCNKSDDDSGHDDHSDHDDHDDEGGTTGGDTTGGDTTGGDTTGGDTEGDTTGGGTDGDCDPITDVTEYAFDSAFIDGESSVKYTGQIMRQALMVELKAYIGGLTDEVDAGSAYAAGDVVGGLDYYFRFDADSEGDNEFDYFSFDTLQTKWSDISSKNLVDKIAGNDSATDHRAWTGADSKFYGWEADGVNSPESLIDHWFSEIEAQVLARQEGDADASEYPVFLTPDGVDRQQLIQKFLTGAITFSQGADDYLSNDVEGKGLLADPDCEKDDAGECTSKYSGLEHAWDEGYGYFGGATNYGQLTADEIKANENDANGDGKIDLLTEYNWGASVNAAKRDVGSAGLDAADQTDLVTDAWVGFSGGRQLIADAQADGDPALTDDEKACLIVHRDLAVSSWEKAVAATVVHYINDVKADILSASPSTPEEFSFTDYAKHWGEAKGFGLWFQFNPNSPMLGTDAEGKEHFQKLHQLLGMSAPKWTPAGGGDYMAWFAELDEAKALLGEAYGFTDAQLENW